MDSEMMIMRAVPLRRKGFVLNAYKNEIPSTEPGMMYGNMVTVSRILVKNDFFRTVKYEINIPSTTTTAMAHNPNK